MSSEGECRTELLGPDGATRGLRKEARVAKVYLRKNKGTRLVLPPSLMSDKKARGLGGI